MSPNPQSDRLKALMDCLSKTKDDEADCTEFDREVECLAEWLASGGASESRMKPAVEAHLQHSQDCREEFEALVTILKAELKGELGDS